MIITTAAATSYVFWSSIAMIITAIVTYFGCSIFAAPYGRYSKDGWGIMLPAQLAWFLMESPNLWTSYVIYSFSQQSTSNTNNIILSLPNKILLGCFLLHYINRSIVYPIRMGIATPMPITVMLAAFFFCTWNGTHQALQLIFVHQYQEQWLYNPCFIFGIICFFFGMFINIESDIQLINMKNQLRKSMNKKAKESDYLINNGNSQKPKRYGIPRGGMFEYVSCANFFGEIVEWWGFAVAAGFSLPTVAFASYTMVYLISRSFHYHQFYYEKFDDYPKNRKAIIPFLL